jgi:hypothetical protein
MIFERRGDLSSARERQKNMSGEEIQDNGASAVWIPMETLI